MKIKFIKEYRAVLNILGSFGTSNIYKAGDVKDAARESAKTRRKNHA